jgi:hypothetical protein
MSPLDQAAGERLHPSERLPTSPARGSIRVTSLTCLAVLAGLLLPTAAWSGGARGIHLESNVSKSDDAVGVVVRVTSGPDAPCYGAARKGARRMELPALITGAGGEGQWSWQIAPGVPAGTWHVAVQCTRSRSAVQHDRLKFAASAGGGRGRHRRLYVAGTLQQHAVGVQLAGGNGAGGGSLYPHGQCTWYVATRRPDLPYFPGRSGDALRWIVSARRAHLRTGEIPVAGAVAVFQPLQYGAGKYGHVAYVEAVDGSNMTVSEANYRHRPAGSRRAIAWRGLQFIYPPPPPPPPPPKPLPPPPPPALPALKPPGDSSNVVTRAWYPRTTAFRGPLLGSTSDVAADRAGNLVALRPVGLRDVLLATVRSPTDGVWQAPQQISGTGLDPNNAQLAMDPLGNATAVWTRSDGTRHVLQSASRPAATGVWQPPVDVSGADGDASSPAIAAGARGDVTVVWTRTVGTTTSIQSATRPRGSDAWGAPQDLPLVRDVTKLADSAQVAVDADGNATAVWNQGAAAVGASRRPVGSGAWEDAERLATSGAAAAPQVAVNDRGDAVAVWGLSDSTSAIIRAATRDAASTSWQSPQNISLAGQTAREPQVAVDSQGNATAVWLRSNGGIVVVQAARRAAATGLWEAPVDLSGDRNARGLQLAVNGRGDAIAAWTRDNGADLGMYTIVQARVRPAATATWTAAQDVADQDPMFNDQPALAIDGQGNGVLAWITGEQVSIATAGFDAAGPLLNALSIPATGAAGAPAPFSVTPADVWSAVASTTWDFGDGTGAEGGTASHAYSQPGSYSVTVTSVDSLGNSSTATRTIEIAARPPSSASSPAGPSSSSPSLAGAAAPGRAGLTFRSLTVRVSGRTGTGPLAATCSSGWARWCRFEGRLYRMPPAGRGGARGASLGTLAGRIAAGRRGTLRLRLTGRARRVVRSRRTVKAQLVGTVADAAGHTAAVRRTLSLRQG